MITSDRGIYKTGRSTSKITQEWQLRILRIAKEIQPISLLRRYLQLLSLTVRRICHLSEISVGINQGCSRSMKESSKSVKSKNLGIRLLTLKKLGIWTWVISQTWKQIRKAGILVFWLGRKNKFFQESRTMNNSLESLSHTSVTGRGKSTNRNLKPIKTTQRLDTIMQLADQWDDFIEEGHQFLEEVRSKQSLQTCTVDGKTRKLFGFYVYKFKLNITWAFVNHDYRVLVERKYHISDSE